MWITFELNGWMAHVNLCFLRDEEAVEDPRARAYLNERKLEPRRVLAREWEGREVEVWQYGECYLGGHVRELDRLRWQGEVSDVLRQAMAEPDDLGTLMAALPPERAREVAWSLAGAVVEAGAAQVNPEDGSKLHLDLAFVREELRKLTGLP